MPETSAPPVTDEPAVIPPSQLEGSMAIFKQARADAGLDVPPADAPPADPLPVDPPVDAPPAKSTIPGDVLDPDKKTPAVHEDVAELLAAELPKGAKKEQIESFGKLKAAAAEKVQRALDRAAELEAKISTTTSPKELEELRGKLTAAQEKSDKIEEEFAKVAFKESPRFKAQFSGQKEAAIEMAKGYLEGTEIKPDIIELAAHATGRKRLDILKDAGLEESTISAILPHLAQVDTVQRNEQAALANWKAEQGKWSEEQAQRQAQEKQKRVEQEEKIWEQVVGKLDLLPLRKSKDSPEWNARAEQLLAEAKRRFNGEGADLPTFAETVAKGVAYDAQTEVVEHLRGEVTSLRAETARLKSAAPGGAISAGTGDGKPVDTSKMSREEQAKSTFNQEKAKATTAQ
jgi:hypothetical protein